MEKVKSDGDTSSSLFSCADECCRNDNSDVQQSYSEVSEEIFHARLNQGWKKKKDIKIIFFSKLIFSF